MEVGTQIMLLRESVDTLEIDPSIFLSGKGSTFFSNVHNSSGTGLGNSIVNDKELISGLTVALEKLCALIDKLGSN